MKHLDLVTTSQVRILLDELQRLDPELYQACLRVLERRLPSHPDDWLYDADDGCWLF